MTFKDTNKIPTLKQKIIPAIDRATFGSALLLETLAKRQSNRLIYDTPPSPYYKRTGNLKAGIQAKRRSNKKASVIDDVFYSGFVEFGTTRMPARPFMRQAFDENISKIVNTWKRIFIKSI